MLTAPSRASGDIARLLNARALVPSPVATTRRPPVGAADTNSPLPVIPYSREPSGAHVNATSPGPSGTCARPPVTGTTNGPRSDPFAAVVA